MNQLEMHPCHKVHFHPAHLPDPLSDFSEGLVVMSAVVCTLQFAINNISGWLSTQHNTKNMN